MVVGGFSTRFSARFKSCPDAKQKQVLRSAYPNFVGAPSCSAQDDAKINKAKMTWLRPCPFKAAIFRIS